METITKLEEFIGKDNIKNNLKVYLAACLKDNHQLEHCLFYGLPGTGKTTLAKIIANELNQKIRIVQGSTIQKPTDVINILISLNDNNILFIDKIHCINKKCFELFYYAMEEGFIDLNIGTDYNTKVTRIKLPTFTLIGATTLLGLLPKPLEDRFGITFYIDEYDINEIKSIIHLYMKKLKMQLSEEEIEIIANASKGIPRLSYKLLRRVYDFKLINTEINVETILQKLRYIFCEYDINNVVYLKCLASQDHPIGIKTIAQAISIDELTIQLKIEPYLLKKNLISKTQNGRIISKEGIILLKQLENSQKN